MIFLLNHERIRYEVLELARRRLLLVLNEALHRHNADAEPLQLSDIEITLEAEPDGRVARHWSLKRIPDGMRPDGAREVGAGIVRYVTSQYLEERLEDAEVSAREWRHGQAAG